LWAAPAAALGIGIGPAPARLDGRLLAAEHEDGGRAVLAWRDYLLGRGAACFDPLDIRSMGAERLREAFPEASCAIEEMRTYTIDLPATFTDDCAAAFSPRTLRKMRHAVDAMRRAHHLQLRETDHLTRDQLARITEIHDARQIFPTGRGEDRHRFFDSPNERDLLLAQLDTAARAGQARHYLLEIDGRIMGFDLCFAYQGVLFACLTAFDGAVSRDA
jgi:hypothetical protein